MSTRKTGADLLKKYSVQRLSELKAQTAQKIDEYEKSLDEGKLSAEQEKELDTLMNMEEGIIKEMNKRDRGNTGFLPATASNRFENFGEMAQAIAAASSPADRNYGNFRGGQVDGRLNDFRMATGLNEARPSEGGFLVDEERNNTIIQSVFKNSNLAQRVARYKMNGPANSMTFLKADETSRADGSRWGGVRAYWKGEAGQMTGVTPEFAEMQLELNKLTVLIYVTDELLEDSAALESYLNETAPKEIAFKLEDAILNGTGAGQPLGIYNSDALVTVSKETGQAADTIVTENILKMYAQWIGNRGSGVWVTNRDTFPQLAQLTIDAGTGGNAIGLINNIAGEPYSRMLGMPILEMEQAQTLGAKGDIYLIDTSQYLLIDKALRGASSIHLKFDYNETAFRWVYRVDGQPKQDSSYTAFKGANSLSPFVTLQART